MTHALLDPDAMRRQLGHWITSDTHTLFGTSSLTGGPVGQWYSVNDYAMTRLVRDYVRFTGDAAFLDERAGRRPQRARPPPLLGAAWQGLRRSSTLADYGEIENLLECVSSYTHEVASFNAANVWNLRVTADVLESRGDVAGAAELRAEADELVAAVLELYLPGEGFFAAGQPDGTKLPVRHCYDFNIVGTTIPEDLDETTRREMVDFFQRELQTPEWLRALSPWDPDASYSVRPDHQWNGAYTAWPADAARALVALGEPKVALDWLPGLARTANQGPPGQAHFVAEAQPLLSGGARKAPPQLPYINDWACSSSGAYVALVIESLFGAAPGIDGLGEVTGASPSSTRRRCSAGFASATASSTCMRTAGWSTAHDGAACCVTRISPTSSCAVPPRSSARIEGCGRTGCPRGRALRFPTRSCGRPRRRAPAFGSPSGPPRRPSSSRSARGGWPPTRPRRSRRVDTSSPPVGSSSRRHRATAGSRYLFSFEDPAGIVVDGPPSIVRFTVLAPAEADYELWLPFTDAVEVVALRADAPVAPPSERRRSALAPPRSSISHGYRAESTTGTWPVVAASRRASS